MSKETPIAVTLDTIENATRATLREFLTDHDVAYRAKDTLAVLRLAALAVLSTDRRPSRTAPDGPRDRVRRWEHRPTG
jgi:hypothetical protein